MDGALMGGWVMIHPQSIDEWWWDFHGWWHWWVKWVYGSSTTHNWIIMGFKMDDALMDGWFYGSSTTHSWIIMGFQMDGALMGEWVMVHPQSIDES